MLALTNTVFTIVEIKLNDPTRSHIIVLLMINHVEYGSPGVLQRPPALRNSKANFLYCGGCVLVSPTLSIPHWRAPPRVAPVAQFYSSFHFSMAYIRTRKFSYCFLSFCSQVLPVLFYRLSLQLRKELYFFTTTPWSNWIKIPTHFTSNRNNLRSLYFLLLLKCFDLPKRSNIVTIA